MCKESRIMVFNMLLTLHLILLGILILIGDQKSTYGYVFMIFFGPICWLSKKHSTISQSSTKAQYRGAKNVATQTNWLQGIMFEFGIFFRDPTIIFCDRQNAIKISTHLFHRKRTKHIEIHMHYIIGLVHAHIISLQ